MADSMPPDSIDSLLDDDYYALLNLGKNVIECLFIEQHHLTYNAFMRGFK